MGVLRTFGRGRTVFAIVLAGVIAISGGTLLMAGEPDGYTGPDQDVLTARRAGSIVNGSLAQVREVSDPARSINWQIWRYATDAHPACHDAVALTPSGAYLGYVSGCGPAEQINPDPYFMTGWVQAPDEQRAYITFGVVPGAKAALVHKVAWERIGSSERKTDTPVDGVWAFVTSASVDVRVKLLDVAQTVQGSHRIAPIQEATR